jgi:hypothetical protein
MVAPLTKSLMSQPSPGTQHLDDIILEILPSPEQIVGCGVLNMMILI